MGKAGTGKTLLAMAAGLKRTVLDREFRRLVVARPTISMGKELGFLPGSLEEKLAPWMQPIHDALEMLSDLNMGHDHRRSGDLMRSGTIVVEALSYIRGRSIANQFMIIDEAQNLTPLEAKTIITRVGNGTKIIFTGDPYQIDNPYAWIPRPTGSHYVISRFRDQAIAAHIELQKGERSELAELAANILLNDTHFLSMLPAGRPRHEHADAKNKQILYIDKSLKSPDFEAKIRKSGFL